MMSRFETSVPSWIKFSSLYQSNAGDSSVHSQSSFIGHSNIAFDDRRPEYGSSRIRHVQETPKTNFNHDLVESDNSVSKTQNNLASEDACQQECVSKDNDVTAPSCSSDITFKIPVAVKQKSASYSKSLKRINIEKWVIKKPKKGRIYVEGKIIDGENKGEFQKSSCVVKRIDANNVQTRSGTIYKLVGPLAEECMAFEEFGASFIEAFRNGFPKNWKLFLQNEGINSTRKENTTFFNADYSCILPENNATNEKIGQLTYRSGVKTNISHSVCKSNPEVDYNRSKNVGNSFRVKNKSKMGEGREKQKNVRRNSSETSYSKHLQQKRKLPVPLPAPKRSKLKETPKVQSANQQLQSYNTDDECTFESLSMSSRGRKRIPPLKWWANERVVYSSTYVTQEDDTNISICRPQLEKSSSVKGNSSQTNKRNSIRMEFTATQEEQSFRRTSKNKKKVSSRTSVYRSKLEDRVSSVECNRSRNVSRSFRNENKSRTVEVSTNQKTVRRNSSETCQSKRDTTNNTRRPQQKKKLPVALPAPKKSKIKEKPTPKAANKQPQHDKTDDVGIVFESLPTSIRGRKIIPPLKWWAGERVVDSIDHVTQKRDTNISICRPCMENSFSVKRNSSSATKRNDSRKMKFTETREEKIISVVKKRVSQEFHATSKNQKKVSSVTSESTVSHQMSYSKQTRRRGSNVKEKSKSTSTSLRCTKPGVEPVDCFAETGIRNKATRSISVNYDKLSSKRKRSVENNNKSKCKNNANRLKSSKSDKVDKKRNQSVDKSPRKPANKRNAKNSVTSKGKKGAEDSSATRSLVSFDKENSSVKTSVAENVLVTNRKRKVANKKSNSPSVHIGHGKDMITARKGSMKYKRQVLQMLDKHNENYQADMFENTLPSKNNQFFNSILESNDDDDYCRNPIATPVFNPVLLSMIPNEEPTPHLSSTTPTLLKSLNRTDMDTYQHHRKKWKNTSMSNGTRVSSQKTMTRCTPVPELSTDEFDVFAMSKDDDLDDDEDDAHGPKDYYFDDET